MKRNLRLWFSVLFLIATVLPVFAVFPGNSLIFENNKYVVCNGIPAYGAITIEGWINHSSLTTYTQRYFTMMNETAVLRRNGPNIQLYVKSSSGSLTHVTYAYPLAVGQWVHVAGTYDGATAKLYVNGNLVGSVPTSGGIFTNTGEFRIGNDGESMTGQIDEVRLWNVARTQQQIADNRFTELSGTETGLQSYWKFNESSGTTAIDACNNSHGTLINMTDANRVVSTVPDPSFMLTPIITVDTLNPLLSVISPNGEENWYIGDTHDIMWTATDSNILANPIQIELSADNGSSYTSLAANLSNNGSYSWTIPDISVPQAKIRISASDSFGNIGFDESNAAFTLGGPPFMVTPVVTIDTVNPTADLLLPNGGEFWYIGETHDILWTAFDNHIAALPIKLEYKQGSTGTWITIQPELSNTGSYSWQLPAYSSAETLVRLTVVDAFGNTGSDLSQNPFSIDYVPPAIPVNVNLQILNSRDALITWDPVTLNIFGTEITPSTYLVIYNQSSDANNEAAYYYLGENETATGYTHLNVARRAPHMYYRVVAVMENDDRLSGILTGLNRKTNKAASDIDTKVAPVSWIELKRLLSNKQN